MVKAKAKFKMVQLQRARPTLIASVKDWIHTQLKEIRESWNKYLENNETSNENHNHGAKNEKAQNVIKINCQDITAVETGRVVSTLEVSECDKVTTCNTASGQWAVIPSPRRPVQMKHTISSTNNG